MIRRRIHRLLSEWSTPVDEQDPSVRDLVIALAVLLLVIGAAYGGPMALWALRP